MNCETVNQPITVNEIKTAIRALKDQKAAGPDGLIGEFYKLSSSISSLIMVYFLTNGRWQSYIRYIRKGT